MGFVNKFLNSMKLDDDYDDEFEPDEDFDDLDYREEPKKSASKQSYKKSYDPELDLDDTYEEDETPRKSFFGQPKAKPAPSSNVTPMRRATNMEVCMIRPTSLDDFKEICETLNSGRAVVINVEGINFDIAQRIIDLTSGACFAINGNLQTISRYIFIVTPASIYLSGDFNASFGDKNSLNLYI